MLSEYGENLETFYIICKESKNYLKMMNARAKYSYGPIIVNFSHNDEKLLMRQKRVASLKRFTSETYLISPLFILERTFDKGRPL